MNECWFCGDKFAAQDEWDHFCSTLCDELYHDRRESGRLDYELEDTDA